MSDLKLTRQRIIAFALPAIPISALGLPLVVYVPPFYSELGLSLSVVGNIFALARFWDLITDPVLGTSAIAGQPKSDGDGPGLFFRFPC